MSKVTETQQTILRHLIYTEHYNYIREETGLAVGVIRDDLITLSHLNMIEIFEDQDGTAGRKIRHFDNDHPELFHYRATKWGLDAMSSR
ncbi:hypothetical protein [Natronogracilivirga saccharolytica]|uniref:Uncharacterized protein n=1 Tax=Natronogracilivirga saccharolytica TaxID=2812953 RepID=A0A8J7RJ00_9BACT|nr:hypothetical protein [Natronogracilivirga saccharolytica]MBP3192655.1 hypothetical protein [Natronogracilivirga saccharolytica]